MNNEFTYYKVKWLELDLIGFYNTKDKTFYFEKDAFEYKELVDSAETTKNCIIEKITEKTEVIAWQNKNNLI